MPKVQGNSNCLFGLSLLTSVRYDIKIYGRFLPLWIFPLLYTFYEVHEILK